MQIHEECGKILTVRICFFYGRCRYILAALAIINEGLGTLKEHVHSEQSFKQSLACF
jgi:hypothetical protein